MNKKRRAMDGSEAAARAAYALSEVIALYPITPASAMGEWTDDWAAQGRKNLWGSVPKVIEMQSEAGAAGALHGALSVGSLATTFTASQGLLLMMPDMYKIAGELTPFVMHVAARALATHGLSIFGDHSDVMAVRGTGFAMLASSSVQEAADLAVVAHAATLSCRVPFVHFFDGFRTSHEISDIELPDAAVLDAMMSGRAIRAHRARALTPDRPTIRGTAQNPDVFFQAREASNPYHAAVPAAVEQAFARFAESTGRRYRLFDYVGHPEADRVMVLMGSGAGAAEEAVEALNARGEKVGLLKVRLYRPFDAKALLAALPPSARRLAVLDRAKEPGSLGEPLFLDVLAALAESRRPKTTVIGGRYGLSSKEFTPAMSAAVFAELARKQPKSRFTIGIQDDVTHASLDWDPAFSTERPDTTRAVFYGLGSDGTVGANKTAIKIVSEKTALHVQAYFVYDSKKSGSLTVSHLRCGPRPIRSTYLIRSAGFVACHQEAFLERYDMLSLAAEGGVFLLNTARPEQAWDLLPREVQEDILAKKLRFFAIDAYALAREAGLGPRINTIMQVCFFKITGLVPDYLESVKAGIRKAYGAKDPSAVDKNLKAADGAAARLVEVKVPSQATAERRRLSPVPARAPAFVYDLLGPIIAGRGDELPVSAMPADGTFPTGTSQWEKRATSREVPRWEPGLCIQCNKCALVCPHAAIRVKAFPPEAGEDLPAGFKWDKWKGREFPEGTRYTIQVSPEDCTGCDLCVAVCPAKSKDGPPRKALAMAERTPESTAEGSGHFKRFLAIPEAERSAVNAGTVKGSQLLQPLFEFSGACAGCGETPYLKLLTQLFGDRLLVANATGCSSIFGGNLPTTPWTCNEAGRGPAWSNSLFEDNAEFGLGFRAALDHQGDYARSLLSALSDKIGAELVQALLSTDQATEAGIEIQRALVAELQQRLGGLQESRARDLNAVAGALTRKSVWIVGGDGWAYDIGSAGLDHVLRSGENVKVLVLDTEVYSNTGGQASKSTPKGAVARFAAAGKRLPRKDLAMTAATMGGIYVARIALGAQDTQTVKAFIEAESFDGPALIVAYSPCIAHGFEMSESLAQQKRAVDSGHWPLFRSDPRREQKGESALIIDSMPPSLPLEDFIYRESRYRRLTESDPQTAARLLAEAKEDIKKDWAHLRNLAASHREP